MFIIYEISFDRTKRPRVAPLSRRIAASMPQCMFALATGRPKKMATPSAYRLVVIAFMLFCLGGWWGEVPANNAMAFAMEGGNEM